MAFIICLLCELITESRFSVSFYSSAKYKNVLQNKSIFYNYNEKGYSKRPMLLKSSVK